MVNIETLPKMITVDGNYYDLNLYITFRGRLCVSYEYSGGPAQAMQLKIEYNILSQVVEPDMTDPIKYSDKLTDIIDVPNIEMAWNVLSTRVNKAIEHNEVIVKL